MNALIVGSLFFISINLVFFGALHIIMEVTDRRKGKAHVCTNADSWCGDCLDDKQRQGVVDIFGNVLVRG